MAKGEVYDYEFERHTDESQLGKRLGERSADGWEPVSFSIAPSNERVVMLRRKVEKAGEQFTERHFDSRDHGF
jgi:hypothetical protein